MAKGERIRADEVQVGDLIYQPYSSFLFIVAKVIRHGLAIEFVAKRGRVYWMRGWDIVERRNGSAKD